MDKAVGQPRERPMTTISIIFNQLSKKDDGSREGEKKKKIGPI
jgi:hypothetical protein